MSLGHESSALGVARLYAGMVDRFVLDEADAQLAPAVEALGMARASCRPSCAPTATARHCPGRARRGPDWDRRERSRYAPPVTTRIIVPHRGLEAAKTRLAPSLSPRSAIMLASQLLQRVLKVTRQVADDVVVISPSRALGRDRRALRRAAPRAAWDGLNEGLEQARFDALVDDVGTLIVLHGDLPNLQAGDIEVLAGALPDGDAPAVAIAPDRAGPARTGSSCGRRA